MQANITLQIRDADTGTVVGENSTTATVSEDGQSFIIPPGYLPGLAEAPAGDVRVEVINPVTVVEFTGKSVSIDEATGNQILVLTN